MNGQSKKGLQLTSFCTQLKKTFAVRASSCLNTPPPVSPQHYNYHHGSAPRAPPQQLAPGNHPPNPYQPQQTTPSASGLEELTDMLRHVSAQLLHANTAVVIPNNNGAGVGQQQFQAGSVDFRVGSNNSGGEQQQHMVSVGATKLNDCSTAAPALAGNIHAITAAVPPPTNNGAGVVQQHQSQACIVNLEVGNNASEVFHRDERMDGGNVQRGGPGNQPARQQHSVSADAVNLNDGTAAAPEITENKKNTRSAATVLGSENVGGKKLQLALNFPPNPISPVDQEKNNEEKNPDVSNNIKDMGIPSQNAAVGTYLIIQEGGTAKLVFQPTSTQKKNIGNLDMPVFDHPEGNGRDVLQKSVDAAEIVTEKDGAGREEKVSPPTHPSVGEKRKEKNKEESREKKRKRLSPDEEIAALDLSGGVVDDEINREEYEVEEDYEENNGKGKGFEAIQLKHQYTKLISVINSMNLYDMRKEFINNNIYIKELLDKGGEAFDKNARERGLHKIANNRRRILQLKLVQDVYYNKKFLEKAENYLRSPKIYPGAEHD